MPATIENVTLYSVPELADMLKGQKMTGRWFVSEVDVKAFFENLN